MRVCARIQDDTIMNPARGLNGINQLTFVVGLQKRNCAARRFSLIQTHLFNLHQGGCPVNLGLTLAKQIKIWPVQD